MKSDAEMWQLFCDALCEGRISVILENARDSIDGGIITTELDEVIDHLTE